MNPLQPYEDWVVRNSGLVEKLEGLAHTLFFLSPTRVRDSDFSTERMYAAVNLVTLYHEHIRHKRSVSSSRLCGVKLMSLRAIQLCEVAIEMGAIVAVGHSKTKWRMIMAVEVLKMLIRWAILNERGGRMIIEQAAKDPADGLTGSSKPATNPLDAMSAKRFGDTQQLVGKRSGITIRSRASKAAAGKPPSELIAEALYTTRPVAYLALYLQCDKMSWKPWFVSLAMDLVQLQLRGTPNSTQDQEEVTRRRSSLMYYLLRDPIYDKFTKPLLAAMHLRLFNKIPLIASISDLAMGIFQSMNALHFYKAMS